MNNAVNSVGTTFKKWVASAWTDIAEIKGITGPDLTRDTIDVTTLTSVGGYREFIAGFRNGGTVTLSMHFTRAGYDLMKADFESDVPQNYEIVIPDAGATAIEFEGLVTELPLTINVGDAITMDVKIKVSSEPVVSSGGTAAP